MRDKAIPTYTYLAGEMNGTIGEKICDSVGYGIPYSTQYTSPMKQVYTASNLTLPQADPNGLFSPSSAEGTWVLCKVPGTDTIMPQYIEPKVISLTFPKEARGQPTAPLPGALPSDKVDKPATKHIHDLQTTGPRYSQ